MPEKTEAEAVADMVTVPFVQGPIDGVEGLQLVAHSDEWKHELIDVERFAPSPRRKQGHVTLRDGMSFVQYVLAQKTPSTVIFADANKLTAIFNHHEPNRQTPDETIMPDLTAGWNDQRADFEMKFTPSWTAWTGFDDTWLGQKDFAEFLEERIPDIAEPAGADLLEIVRTLQIKVETNWQNVITLQHDGVRMTFTDDVSTGDLIVPDQIKLVLTPFDGSQPVGITARIRFSKPDGNGRVKFMFRLGEIVQQTLDDALEQIAKTVTESTGVQVLMGRLVK